jgi:dienelactone hydrolase
METKVVEFDDKVKKDDIIMSWSFTTQSISAVLNAMLASIDVKNDDISMGTTSVGDSPLGAADIFLGTLKVPYYLEVPSTNNPTAPLTGYWKGKGGSALTRYNTSPVKNSTLTIPVIMTVPKGATNPPVVIYQHGITRMRTDVLAYADAMAQAGRAVIAIDLPLHGTPTDNLLHTPIEPTFDMDFLNNETGAPGPDGKIDTSGAHFMNLASLLTSRDNIRQGVSNLLVLRRSLKNIANIDATKVGFVAHSLGGIVAVPYLAIEDKPTPSSLIAAGAGIRNMLLESDPFGLQIKAGLKANGIEGEKYDAFMYATQFILESADPINYAADAAQTHPVHLIEIIGDKVVVNKTTEALAGLMQAKAVSTTATDISAGKPGIVRFTQGNHSSVLDPTRGGNFLNVFTEIHTQLATFQASSGTTIKITDDSIIKQ